MSDSTTNLDTISAGQASKEATANELFDAVSTAALYGRRASTCSGLTWGYYGGRWGGSSVANGTLALTASTTNYVTVLRSTGAVSVSTSNANWNNTDTYARAYKIVAGVLTVTSYEDHRAGQYGSLDPTVGNAVGKHAVYIAAGSMRPSLTSGCAPVAQVNLASNQPDIITLDFDASTEEYAQFSFVAPKSWNEGTLTFKAHWSHAATTTNFGVVWALQALGVSDGEAMALAFGTAQTITDTGGTTNYSYTTAESAALTVAMAGSPASGDLLYFRVYRKAADGSDTMAIDARLHGLTIFLTTDAANDA